MARWKVTITAHYVVEAPNEDAAFEVAEEELEELRNGTTEYLGHESLAKLDLDITKVQRQRQGRGRL